jgi:putative aldouronate transport system substrate-binding protein
MKQVLQTFADWYKKGYFKQDWMSSNYDSNRADLVAGKFGIQLFPQWWGFVNAADMINTYGKDGYFEAFDIPSTNGIPTKYPKGFDNGGYIVFNKDSKNIAAALKTLSLYGFQGMIEAGLITSDEIQATYRSDGDALSHVMPMIKTMGSTAPAEIYLNLQYVKRTGDTSIFEFDNRTAVEPPGRSFYYNEILPFLEKGEMGGAGRWLQTYADNSSYDVTYKINTENRWVFSAMIGAEPEEIASYGSTLDDILKEGFTQIIVGQQPLSYFDTLVAQWKASGGDNCTRVMNQVYGKK